MSSNFAFQLEQGLGANYQEAPEGGIYGVYWDGSPNSAWLRTDDAALFSDPSPAVNNGNGSSPFDVLMPWSGMERVNDSEAGTLVSIPKFWYKWTRDDEVTGDMKLQIANYAADGFLVSPAHADRGDGKGERNIVYVGAYHCSTNDYKSTSGVLPKVSITRETARNSISNLSSTIWQWDYAMYWTICMLYLVEYADWDSQAKIGLGGSFSGSSIEYTGITDFMSYHTGVVEDEEYEVEYEYSYGHVRYRYIEDLWANVYDWVDGIYMNGDNIYCIKTPSNFSDTTGGTLIETLNSNTSLTGLITTYSNPSINNFEYALIPIDALYTYSAYNTYICSETVLMSDHNVFYCGCNYFGSDHGGLFCFNSYLNQSHSETGSRLMKLP